MTRAFLRLVARFLIGAVFGAHWAVAAYACPALSPAATAPSAVAGTEAPEGVAPSGPGMAPAADCDDMAGSMDPASPNLCAEHCKQGQQSDHAASLVVPPALLTVRYALPPLAGCAAGPRPVVRAPDVRAAAFPPHAILHCVFRI